MPNRKKKNLTREKPPQPGTTQPRTHYPRLWQIAQQLNDEQHERHILTPLTIPE